MSLRLVSLYCMSWCLQLRRVILFQNVALQNVLILYVRASSIKESKFNFLVKCHSGKRHFAVSHGTYKLQQVNLIFSSNVTLLSVIILNVMMSSVAASNFFSKCHSTKCFYPACHDVYNQREYFKYFCEMSLWKVSVCCMPWRFQLKQVNLIFWKNVTLLSVIILYFMMS
jgi:hypothetical protein